ncbi:uncharacterized protein C4orf51 homolog [Paroedura picta]|uniref:uncharacterized protein C4orf51 homolog n=1 Tax=Paroedura picta TaxID=143630 RepID=UPI004055CD22
MAKYLFLAPGVNLPFSPLAPETFEEIKTLAGEAWKRHTQTDKGCASTYGGAYGNKGLDAATSSRLAPSSPTRVHKPHPPQVFLVNRLHYIPGHYGNAKRTVAADTGYLKASSNFPHGLGESQLQPQHINYNTVSVASPVTPLVAIQHWKKHASEYRNQTAENTETTSSNSQDIPIKICIPNGFQNSESEESDSVSSQL